MTREAEIADRLEGCFREIMETRMEGIPILNGALSVRALGVQEWDGQWLCVLLTPWFMNLVLLPKDADCDEVASGEKRLFPFPAGPFEFIRGEEQAIGPYWSCSLFSPVQEFADQQTAEAAGHAALEELFNDVADEGAPDVDGREEEAGPGSRQADEGEMQPRQISRRAFLSGARRTEELQ